MPGAADSAGVPPADAGAASLPEAAGGPSEADLAARTDSASAGASVKTSADASSDSAARSAPAGRRGLWRVVRTSTFRLVAVYLMVFAASVAAVLGYTYWQAQRLLQAQVEQTIAADVRGIAEQYAINGLAGVMAVLRRRTQHGVPGGLYLLAAPDGKVLAGNLPRLPDEVRGRDHSGWVDFSIRVITPSGPRLRHVRAYYIQLNEGFHLIIGRDIEHLFQFRRVIRNILLWTLALTTLLGVGGGLLLSRNFLRRIDGITASVRAIRAGRLARRVPVEGSGDELDRLAESLNDMLDQIERLMRGMREVSSNIAHDLKTPLTRLKAQAEDALRAGDAAQRREALQSTIAQADELLRTFNSLLLIARAEAGQARAGFSEVDVAEVAREIAELYEPLVEEQGGAFSLDAPDSARIVGDRQLIAQALVNLLDNALKYGRQAKRGLRIDVRVRLRGGMVELEVADNGPGIPPDMREKVKERFVRLDKARSAPGSGLGLSLVASIARLHGGELVLQDNAPGLRAILRLPVRQDNGAKSTARASGA